MNDEDISQFIKAFSDFMKHSEEQIDSHQKWEEAKNYTKLLYEQKAAELDITIDYYIQEFI
jgi:hypothetical protein